MRKTICLSIILFAWTTICQAVNEPTAEISGEQAQIHEKNINEQTSESTQEQSQNSKIDLAETDIGRAVNNENIKDFEKAVNKLEYEDRETSIKILTATDKEGNNIFHLMAQVQKLREELNGRMLYLILVIFNFQVQNILQKDNKDGLTPREVAQKAKNYLAVKYLTEAENVIKTLESDALFLERFEQGLEEIPQSELDILDREASTGIIKRGSIGSGLTVAGGGAILSSMYTGDGTMALLGISQLVLGVGTCYDAFKSYKSYNQIGEGK